MKPGTKRKPRPKPCPYCGKLFVSVGLHEPGCVQNPAARERTLPALQDERGYQRTLREYREDPRGGLACSTLLDAYGNWAGVAAAFGLRQLPISTQHGGRLDEAIERLGPEMDRQMAEYRRLTSAGWRG